MVSTPVQCDFRAALKEGQPIIAAITLELAGKGLSQAAILVLFTVADVSGDGEIACGELNIDLPSAPTVPE